MVARQTSTTLEAPPRRRESPIRPTQMPLMLTATDAAIRLGLSRRVFYAYLPRLLAAGLEPIELPMTEGAVRRTVRYTVASIDRLMVKAAKRGRLLPD
jgi:hypothetical protein